MSKNETIEVRHKKGEEYSIEMLTWPQNYENFIKDIIAKFKLNKNTKIDLQLITNDDDDIYINSQDNLNPYLEEDGVGIKYFNVFFDGSPDNIEDNKSDKEKNNNQKCSSIEHKEINAVIFCQNCKVYFCNKCENFHSKIFQGHLITNLANEKNNVIFTGLCQENNHMSALEYYCKSHNKLCCGLCITKIKDEKNGQHKDCLITSLKEIKSEKEEKFKNNYNKLQEISKSIEPLITQLKNRKIDINKKKEQIMNEIQKIFTKLRTVLNNREDELLKEVEEAYKKNCFDDNIIKESEKISGKTKKCLDSVNDLKTIKEKNKELNFEINFYIEFEKNLNKIDDLIQIINKLNSKTYELNLEVNNDKLESDIKKFGKINQITKEIEIKKIKFEKKNVVKIIEMKDTKFININSIKIKNVGNISAHKLFFIINKEKSSNNFCFLCNSKVTDEYEIAMPGELKPNESLNCNISVAINNPKPGKEYKVIIYAKENDEIISEPFEIIIKINKLKVEPIVMEIFEEIEDGYNLTLLKEKEEIIEKIQELKMIRLHRIIGNEFR